MRFSLVVILMMLFSYQSHSQALWAILFGKKIKNDKVTMGVDVGVNYSSTTDRYVLKNFKLSFAIGAYTEIDLNKAKTLSIENYFYFAYQSGPRKIQAEYLLGEPFDSLYNGEIFHRNFQYFSLLPAFKYSPIHWFAFGLAPQLSLKLFSKDIYRIDIDEDESAYSKRLRDEVFWFDFGISFRLQFLLKKGEGIRFNLAYNQGLIDVYKNYSLAGKALNASYMFTVGIPIKVKNPDDTKKLDEDFEGPRKEKKKNKKKKRNQNSS